MSIKHSFLFVLLFTFGCGQGISTETAPDGSAVGATASGEETAQSGSSSLQTVTANGVSFQAPADWTVLPSSTGAGVSSPNDFANEKMGVPVSVAVIPSPDPAVAYAAQAKTKIGDLESEESVTVAGIEGTKIVTTTSSKLKTGDEYVSRNVKVYAPTSNGVLAIQVAGENHQVLDLMPQIDAIIDSVTLK